MHGQRLPSNPSLRTESLVALGAFGALTAGAAGLGVRASHGEARGRWFRRLRKPPFQPPAAIFAPVWTVLYGLIAFSGWRVWNRPAGPARSRALALWGVQLGLNAAWSPLFFGKRRPRAALVNLTALCLAAAAYSAAARRVDARARWLMAPYLGWLGFATVLNEEVVRLNP
ncbi:tryptophan-rich sensory protein [Myxococcaceae bacterium GXIMD 01537]